MLMKTDLEMNNGCSFLSDSLSVISFIIMIFKHEKCWMKTNNLLIWECKYQLFSNWLVDDAFISPFIQDLNSYVIQISVHHNRRQDRIEGRAAACHMVGKTR